MYITRLTTMAIITTQTMTTMQNMYNVTRYMVNYDE